MTRKYFGIPAYEGSLSRRIRVLRKTNPKRGKSAARYALYRDGMTIAEYIKACESRNEGRLALFDITWDTDRKRRFVELVD